MNRKRVNYLNSLLLKLSKTNLRLQKRRLLRKNTRKLRRLSRELNLNLDPEAIAETA